MLAILVILALCLAGWLIVGYNALRSIPIGKAFQRFSPPEGKTDWPKVSILVPARNEEDILEASLRSLLALDYPDFEIILVNDHSTDRTGEIARGIAREDARLQVIEAADLPTGWVGKTWALHQASRAARGEWLLMTDADITHSPKSLRRALAYAQVHGIELFSVLPDLDCETFWERVILPPLGMLFTTVLPPHRCNDPRLAVFLAAGAFILVRASAYRQLGGHEAIRNEMVDDVGMGRLFKRAGFKTWLTFEEGFVRTRMYTSLAEIWEGFSKNFYPASGFSAPKLLGGMFLWLVMVLLPPLALLWELAGPPGLMAASGPMWRFWLAAVTTGVFGILHAGTCKQLRLSFIYVFTLPLGAIMLFAIAFNSFYRYRLGQGLAWKGRTYAHLEEAGPSS